MIDRARLSALIAAHGRIARVVIVEAKGSTPRDPGTAMLVWPGGQDGTIGGGRLELDATRAALDMLEHGPRARLTRLALGPALGQCCGGATLLATEIWDAARLSALPDAGAFARRLDGAEACPTGLIARATHAPAFAKGWLAEPLVAPAVTVCLHGAGHVGLALAALLAPLPRIALRVADTRPERLALLPTHALPVPDPLALVRTAPDDAHHLVMTPDHDLDLELCHAILSRPFASAGLIGSATKWARFRNRLAALGHSDARIARITCPIGDTALGREPQAIAIGVAADLLRLLGAGATATESAA